MVNEFDNLQRVGDIIANHGREMVFALIILIKDFTWQNY